MYFNNFFIILLSKGKVKFSACSFSEAFIPVDKGWEQFNEMNGWIFAETIRCSREYLKKKFG